MKSTSSAYAEEEEECQCSLTKNESCRNLGTFFLLGLINNFAYVVFLSAAGDILPKGYPASVVLLAEMIPIIVSQGLAPLFIEHVPYWFRVIIISASASSAFLIVAFFESVEIKLLGIAIGSISSGFGEITFMALSSYYHPDTVSLYSSGTGGAGIFGSLSYLALTTWLNLTPFLTLIILSPLPIVMSLAYFLLLKKNRDIPTSFTFFQDEKLLLEDEVTMLTGATPPARYFTVMEKLYLQIRLFQYTGPLFLVYFGEYVINQGISPTLLYPTDHIFAGSEYKYYSLVYQVGVFISRSSATVVRIKALWLLAFLQIANMVLLGCVSYFDFIPYIWIIFIIILYEGLIGGAIFVNTFYRVAEEVEAEMKEFCMSSISFWYSLGILLSGVAGLYIQPWLLDHRSNSHPQPAPAPAPAPSVAPQPHPHPQPQPHPHPQPL